jgi:hypothetical protein
MGTISHGTYIMLSGIPSFASKVVLINSGYIKVTYVWPSALHKPVERFVTKYFQYLSFRQGSPKSSNLTTEECS